MKHLKILFGCLLVLKVKSLDINTIAGNGTAGFCGDSGQATLACLNNQWQISTDRKGNLYISDRTNNRIRKVTASGMIVTIAGNGSGGFAGDNGPAINAQLNGCSGVTVDRLGNIYIADELNHRIRKVDTFGIITTICGTGSAGYSGDNGLATNAQLNAPIGVATDTSGNLFISDALNHRIRKVDNSVSVKTLVGKSAAIELFPNPSEGSFFITGYDANVASLPVEITDVTGKLIFKAELLNKNGIAEVSYDLPKGIFFVTVDNGGLRITRKVVINK